MRHPRGIVLWTMLILSAVTAWLAAQPPAVSTFDIVIRNGRVLDGSGNPWYRADIGIRGDRIAAVGALGSAKAATIVDAGDRFVHEDQWIDTTDEPDHDGLCLREQQFLLRAIRTDGDLTEHLDSAIASLEVVLAADRTAREGRTIALE